MDNITGNELDRTSEETEVFTVVTHLIRQIQMMCVVAVIAVHVALERATGDIAESAADIAEALDDDDVAANETGDGSTTVLGSTPQEPAKKKSKISENIIAGLGDFADKFGVCFERTNVKLEIIGTRMGYAHDLSAKRAAVNEVLRKLPITTEDGVKVGMAITQDAQKVDYFFSLDEEEEKMIMVQKLLSSNI